MDTFLETTLAGLHDSVLKAFPGTTRRQHSVDEVRIEHLHWVPFRGMGTLFVKGQARRGGSKNECVIVFKDVRYGSRGKGMVELRASNGETVFLEPILMDSNDALVRCTCKDFHWRMTHFNSLDGSLFGRDRRKYEANFRPGSSNPEELPGICKHLMKMGKALSESSILR